MKPAFQYSYINRSNPYQVKTNINHHFLQEKIGGKGIQNMERQERDQEECCPTLHLLYCFMIRKNIYLHLIFSRIFKFCQFWTTLTHFQILNIFADLVHLKICTMLSYLTIWAIMTTLDIFPILTILVDQLDRK